MSEKYVIRKMHGEGKNRAARSTSIPAEFMKELDIEQGGYVKMYLDKNNEGSKRLWIQKLE